jgi:hypothetical protein
VAVAPSRARSDIPASTTQTESAFAADNTRDALLADSARIARGVGGCLVEESALVAERASWRVVADSGRASGS